jgi:hypothetical protein
MNLLYCNASGAVVSIHDDQQPQVDMSAYPTVVRIIPYSQPLSTLNRVGTAPPANNLIPNPPDSRPYQQPAETPQILIPYAAQVRFNTVNKGFNFTAASGVVPVATDRESYMLVGNTAAYAATLAPTAAIDFTQNNTHYPLTAAEMISLSNQFGALIQQCRTIEAACIADLTGATPTIKVYADVDAKFAGV